MIDKICDYCGAQLIEKTSGRELIVLGCRRGCGCYRTIDTATGLQLPIRGSAILAENRNYARNEVAAHG